MTKNIDLSAYDLFFEPCEVKYENEGSGRHYGWGEFMGWVWIEGNGGNQGRGKENGNGEGMGLKWGLAQR